MDGIVDDLTILIASHQRQLTGAGFDGEHTLVVGDGSHNGVQQSRFTTGSCTGHDKGNAVADAHAEEIHHLLGGKARIHQLVQRHTLRVQKTDRNSNATLFIHDRFLQRGNTGIAGKMALGHGRGVVDDHAGVMQESLNDIHRMLRRMEMLLKFDDSAIQQRQGDIVPTIDIDLFQIRRTKVLGQDTVFRHLAVQLVDEFSGSHAFDLKVTVTEVLIDVGLQLMKLGLIGQDCCVMRRDILLGHFQQSPEVDFSCHRYLLYTIFSTIALNLPLNFLSFTIS